MLIGLFRLAYRSGVPDLIIIDKMGSRTTLKFLTTALSPMVDLFL